VVTGTAARVGATWRCVVVALRVGAGARTAIVGHVDGFGVLVVTVVVVAS